MSETDLAHPIPPAHPLLGHLPAFRADPLGFLTRCAQGDAEIVPLRLPGIRTFLLLSPAEIEQVLVTEHKNFVKPFWLRTSAVRRLLGDGLVTSDGAEWREQRRACSSAFQPGLMTGYGCTMAALTRQIVARWQPGMTFDLPHEMALLTLDVIGQTLLGREIAAQAPEIVAEMDTLIAGFAAPHRLFGLLPLPPTFREAAATRRLDTRVDGWVREALAAPKEGIAPTLVSRLAACPAHGAARKRSLREQVKTFLAAGYESSALVLTWLFILLSAYPEVDAHLSAELQRVLGDQPPMPDDIDRLPYAQAVVQETLRLYPPLWMMGRRVLQACKLGGVTIPAGSLLLISPWAVHRRPALFPDPEAFQPERWLSGDEPSRPRFAYFPFGGGPRVCIGQGFAQMETVLLLATIAQRFRLDLGEGKTVKPWATMTLRPEGHVQVRAIPRQ